MNCPKQEVYEYLGMLTSGFFIFASPRETAKIKCHNLHFYIAINIQKVVKNITKITI